MKKYKVTINELELDFIVIALGAKLRQFEGECSLMDISEEYKRIKEMLENLKAETA